MAGTARAGPRGRVGVGVEDRRATSIGHDGPPPTPALGPRGGPESAGEKKAGTRRHRRHRPPLPPDPRLVGLDDLTGRYPIGRAGDGPARAVRRRRGVGPARPARRGGRTPLDGPTGRTSRRSAGSRSRSGGARAWPSRRKRSPTSSPVARMSTRATRREGSAAVGLALEQLRGFAAPAEALGVGAPARRRVKDFRAAWLDEALGVGGLDLAGRGRRGGEPGSRSSPGLRRRLADPREGVRSSRPRWNGGPRPPGSSGGELRRSTSPERPASGRRRARTSLDALMRRGLVDERPVRPAPARRPGDGGGARRRLGPGVLAGPGRGRPVACGGRRRAAGRAVVGGFSRPRPAR